jgi:hypothetical protein
MSAEAAALHTTGTQSIAPQSNEWSFMADERRERRTASQSRADLNRAGKALLSAAMKLILAFLVWIAMGAVLVTGLIKAVTHGNLWLLGIGLLGFIVLVGKIGCLSHD